ncbi:MAG TPA: Rid family detoxifying hydrolase [Acidimicrobiia bacterium]|nr:Rid family detoxifying hydrolase [Acidimicrobiia bacterium]
MPKQVPPLANAPKPLAPYSVVTEANGFVFLSGQVALSVDGGVTPTDTVEQARLIMTNIGVILADLGLGYDDIVKTTIFLTDIADFGSVNEIYGSYFTSEPPARSTFQVAALPRPEFKVEVEAIAAR